jgi:UDP-N-acetylmuramate-alanine ligase
VQIEDKVVCAKENLLDFINKEEQDVLIMMGAGDIDRLLQSVKEKLLSK